MQRYRSLVALAVALFCGAATAAETDRSLVVEGRYLADILHSTRGGLSTGTKYIDEGQLSASLDLGQLGWNGAQVFVYGMANTAGDFATRYGGEFQKISNIDTRPAVHLFEAWFEQRLLDDRLALRAGLYDLNSEFDANPPAKLFLESSHGIGIDIGQTGRNGPSIFPVTSLAARVAWREEAFEVKAAILDGVPGDPTDVRRTAIKLGHGDGALLIGEIGSHWNRINVSIGAWGYTAKFPDLVATGASGAPQQRTDNRGVYGFANARVSGEENGRGLDVFVRAGTAQAGINPVSLYLGAGAALQGPFASRPDDSAGIAVAIARTGDPFQAATRLAGAPAAGHETDVELTYRARILPWFVIQPDVQLVINPGFDIARRDALIVGIRFEINPFAVFRR